MGGIAAKFREAVTAKRSFAANRAAEPLEQRGKKLFERPNVKMIVLSKAATETHNIN